MRSPMMGATKIIKEHTTEAVSSRALHPPKKHDNRSTASCLQTTVINRSKPYQLRPHGKFQKRQVLCLSWVQSVSPQRSTERPQFPTQKAESYLFLDDYEQLACYSYFFYTNFPIIRK
jgi:hypothetical protein